MHIDNTYVEIDSYVTVLEVLLGRLHHHLSHAIPVMYLFGLGGYQSGEASAGKRKSITFLQIIIVLIIRFIICINKMKQHGKEDE